MRLIGQLHRYSPYDRLPISTNGRTSNSGRATTDDGWSIAATSAADESVTAGSIQVKVAPPATSPMEKVMASIATAASATASARECPSLGVCGIRQGRHKNAMPAPRSSPLDREIVDK